MVLSIALKREYIPKFNGNDKLPVSDQMKIVHRAPTNAMKEKLFPREFKYGADGKVFGSIVVDRFKVLDEFTIDIINCTYQVEGEKEPRKIKTVRDLFDGPTEFDALIEELYNYYQELLNTKINEKN